MILKMFTVFDSKVGAYLPPMFLRSTGEAIRSFSSAVQDSSHQFCKHAEDYTLFEVGAWDDVKCQFVLKETPVSLGLAVEFLTRVAEPEFLNRGVVTKIKEA